MANHDPNQNSDEIEIDFDDTDPIPTDNTDIEESEHATTDVPPMGLIDLIADQKASEARAEIFRNLYNKVGDRINSLKSDIRGTSTTD